jgi:hypothetical protein
MNNAIAWCIVLVILGGCASHVYTNTRASGHPHLWEHPPQPRWVVEGSR